VVAAKFTSVSDLLDLRAIHATWHLGPFAEVRVGDHVTRYVRRGTGPSVVLLAADIETNPIWVPLVESLTPGHRLFIPEPSVEGVHSVSCLRGFVEGIGLAGFTLVAGGASAVSAFELATGEDFTVHKLVLITSDGIPADRSDSRVFQLRPEWTTTESVERILEFMGSEGGNSAEFAGA
jgi:hypothetical protein